LGVYLVRTIWDILIEWKMRRQEVDPRLNQSKGKGTQHALDI